MTITNMAGIGRQIMKSTSFNMFSRNTYSICRQLKINIPGERFNSSTNTTKIEDERDPAPLFFNNQVQSFLKTLTRPDPKKVFRIRKEGHKISDPTYKFMTNEELERERKKIYARMEEKLQMPPVVQKRKPIIRVLSKDRALQGYDTVKYVFTDITYGVNRSDRLIVVRDPDGILRFADFDERFRMNQIYDPIEGRELTPPKMFQEEYLQDLMKRNEYEFVLDRACLQYDPDDPDFHRITQIVYEAINNDKNFNMLRSTRHYGPLVFHLVWTKNISNLLLENINNDMIEDAALLIKLYNIIYSSSKSAEINYDGDDIKYVQAYAEIESPIRGKLLSAIQAYKELEAARKNTVEGVKKAHGHVE